MMRIGQSRTEAPERSELSEISSDKNGILMVAAMQELCDQLEHPMWLYDRRSLRFVHGNRAMLDAAGYTKGELITLRMSDLILSAVGQAFTENVRQALSPFRHLSGWMLLRRDGSLLNLDIRTTNVELEGVSLTMARALPSPGKSTSAALPLFTQPADGGRQLFAGLYARWDSTDG